MSEWGDLRRELLESMDSIAVEFPPGVVTAIRKLYELHHWPQPSPDYDVWMFDELCALYFRLERHIDAVPDGQAVLTAIRLLIRDYMEAEFA